MPDQTPVAGVVRDAAGSPVPDARVFLTAGPVPLPDIAALTDGQGCFTLYAPAPGTYRIQIVTDGPARTEVTVRIEGTEQARSLDIVLPEPGKESMS